MNESSGNYYEISPISALETLKYYPNTKVYGRMIGGHEIKRVYVGDMLSSHSVYTLHDLLHRMQFYLKY